MTLLSSVKVCSVSMTLTCCVGLSDWSSLLPRQTYDATFTNRCWLHFSARIYGGMTFMARILYVVDSVYLGLVPVPNTTSHQVLELPH